ncbi:MAG: imelysin family protein, partial [Polyangiaceae bacterium]
MRAFTTRFALGAASLLISSVGCSSSDGSSAKTDEAYKTEIVTGMHDSLLAQIGALHQAAIEMQAAAPSPTGRGWDPVMDAAAIEATKAAWKRARSAYEQIEGALAPIFPDIDASIDARYDDFLSSLAASGGDRDLFDDHGVTGLHAVERILFVDSTPARVVDFEKALPGYKAAAFPANETESNEFKTKLLPKIIADAQTMADQWTPQKIDLGGCFQKLISLMNEQREKVNKASTNEEESRYSQRTLADIRDNLVGTGRIYALFEPWLVT